MRVYPDFYAGAHAESAASYGRVPIEMSNHGHVAGKHLLGGARCALAESGAAGGKTEPLIASAQRKAR